MKERQLSRFIQEENPAVFQLDEKGLADYEKAKKDILFLMHTIDEWTKNKTLEVGQKNNYCGLLESYARDYTKSLGYVGEMEAERQQRFSEIRGLNQENRELRRQLGDKVSFEDLREKLKTIREQFSKWWRANGFGHDSNEKFTGYGFFTELSGHIFSDHSECGMSDKKKVPHFQAQGFTISHPEDMMVDLTDKNLELISKLLTARFPSCEILEVWANNYRRPIKIKSIMIAIRDLNDFDESDSK